MAGKFHKDIQKNVKSKNMKNNKKKEMLQDKEQSEKIKKKKWNEKENIMFTITIFLIVIVAYAFFINRTRYLAAENEKQFDIVKIENSNYAVIATDGNQFILEHCDISKDKKSLAIDTNTYMKVDCKNLIIHRYNFESVTKK